MYQLNNYLLPQRFTTSTTVSECKPPVSKPVSVPKPVLQSPKLNGPPDHVAFVIHGIGQVSG
jgi:hypothetical protein